MYELKVCTWAWKLSVREETKEETYSYEANLGVKAQIALSKTNIIAETLKSLKEWKCSS